jgi:ABC-type lipoprotein release transport system permease subunit
MYLARADVRSHWRRYAGIAVLVALMCGLSLFSIAGARRTQSSYPRYLARTRASTMSVTSSIFDPNQTDAIAKLPEVEQSRTYVGINAFGLVNGRPEQTRAAEPTGTSDGRFFDQDEFVATHGRRPAPTRLTEIAVNEHAASEFGYHVGDHIEFGLYDLRQLTPAFFKSPTPPQATVTATIVGIGVFPDEVLQDESDRTARVLFTPAFTRAYARYRTYSVQGLILRHGDRDVAAVKRRVTQLLPPGAVEFRVTSVDLFHAQQAVRPLSVALSAFGIITGFAGLVLVVQALARVLRVQRADRAVVRAIGATPEALVVGAAIGPSIAVAGGTILAVLLAFVGSVLMPLGPVRRLERTHPMTFDTTVLALGGLIFAALLVAAIVTIAIAERPQRLAARRANPRPARTVAAALAAGLRPTAVTGLRFAFENDGEGAVSASTRSVMAGAALALAALIAAITFGASLRALVDHPRLYGWSGDAVVSAANGYGVLPRDEAGAILARDPAVEAWSGAYFGAARVEGRDTPLLGMDAGDALLPPMLSGRPLAATDEIVLGAATASSIHKHIGDIVTFAGAGAPQRLRIVGIATFPSLGAIHTAHPSLGVGALVAHQEVPGYDRDITGAPVGDKGPRVIFVRFRRGTSATAEIAHVKQITAPLRSIGGLDVVPVERPAEITSSRSASGAPIVLGTALGIAALISLGLALTGVARRRRRDVAILRTLGFTGRDLNVTFTWLATSIIVVGLLVGVPLGVIAGRALWNAYARRLDVIAAPDVPVAIVAALAAAAIVVANVLTVLPSRIAQRFDVAPQLRPE